MDAGDPFTHGRSYRCSKYARRLAREFDFDESGLFDLEYAGLLQDLGKKAVLYGILQKPGPLNDDERTRMATHSQISAEVLGEIPFLEGVAAVIRHLNERFDGGGRAQALRGSSIPLASRLLAVVSAFDAMTSDRPYRAGLTSVEAYSELRREAGSRFDPTVVEEFIRLHQNRALYEEFDAGEIHLYMHDGKPPGQDGLAGLAA
jgi:HD-GYP domain-containing protein (c-di-GMP phosphodiesterase class II)